MLTIPRQVERGALVCPATRERLHIEDDHLVTEGGSGRYPYRQGMAVFLPDIPAPTPVAASAGETPPEAAPGGLLAAVKRRIDGRLASISDHRTLASLEALALAVDWQPDDALCISVGGGPSRPLRQLVNVNIQAVPGVDVVATAYALPYADGSVDSIHCEAVLEHIELPDVAVAEMLRVARPGAPVYGATPFLQPFHGYPSHYQNFTLEGQRRLFERAGFRIQSAGVCVGPTFAMAQLSSSYVAAAVTNRIARAMLRRALGLLWLPLRRIDRRLNLQPQAHELASTTFVLARKPGPGVP